LTPNLSKILPVWILSPNIWTDGHSIEKGKIKKINERNKNIFIEINK